MDYEGKIAYNKEQAEQYGWNPTWFDCLYFNDDLVDAIYMYQKGRGLSADGMCGPSTYRRIYTEREEDEDEDEITLESHEKSWIIHNGQDVEIFWDKVLLWGHQGGLWASEGNYSAYSSPRTSTLFVTHWDVCLSSRSCFKVVENRGISVHFLIDNDGLIFQTLDTQHAAWHAGSRTANHRSIGVEVSDAYDTQYQSKYVAKGFGERPIWEGKQVHGRTLSPFLGFYPIQLEALAALWEAISFAADIPLEVPTVKGVDDAVVDGSFKGFCSHYHLTERKIDCAGLDHEYVKQKALQIRQKRLNQD